MFSLAPICAMSNVRIGLTLILAGVLLDFLLCLSNFIDSLTNMLRN